MENANGSYNLSVTFAVGTDPDMAQVNVMNRVQQAQAKLPAVVAARGISVRRRFTNILGRVTFYAPKQTRNRLFPSNWVAINVQDALLRVKGIGDVVVFGALDYSMGLWLDPERIAALGMSPEEVIGAIQNRNIPD